MLYVIPNIISEDTQAEVIPNQVKEAIKKCDIFYVENLRTARRYISSLKLGLVIEDLVFELVDKKTTFEQCFDLIQPLIEGKTGGIISESGCPGIADPGARLVHLAHQFKIKTIPLVGPSSILLALMASGMNGQSFAFHGYLPIDRKERQQRLRELEKESKLKDQTKIFMDTPYRNEQLMFDILKVCRKDSFLCVAKDVTGDSQMIQTRSVGKWNMNDVSLKKIPTIFLLYGN